MDIVLYYRGPLHANGDAKEKHRIRECFHRQLAQLWSARPLSSYYQAAANPDPPDHGAGLGQLLDQKFAAEARLLREATTPPSLIKTVGAHQFLPLVCQRLWAVAEIELTFLRPEAPGNIVTQGGDIDNRIKTLLDALKVPDVNQARPEVTGVLDSPFHCLLEDDNLITRIGVRTEHLLEPVSNKNEVILLHYVKIRRTQETLSNYVIA